MTGATGDRVRSYLDYNATAPLRPEVEEAVLWALGLPGNPSSVHAEGRAARAAVEKAGSRSLGSSGLAQRRRVHRGGTEAANTVLSPSLRDAGKGPDCRVAVGPARCRVLDGTLERASSESPSTRTGSRFGKWAPRTVAETSELVRCSATTRRGAAAGREVARSPTRRMIITQMRPGSREMRSICQHRCDV